MVNFLFLKNVLFVFRLREREGETEGEKETLCERNIDQLPLACTSSETGEVTQACALPRIQASDLMLCRMMPNQLIHTDQGAHGVFSRRDHILSYKTSFSKLKIEIISCTFSDHNGTKTRIHKKKPEQHTHMQRLSNTL